MTGHSPWRARNLQRVAQARELLRQARQANEPGGVPKMSEPTAPDEDEVVSTPPDEDDEDDDGDQ